MPAARAPDGELGGYSKAEVKQFIWEHARVRFGDIPRGNLVSLQRAKHQVVCRLSVRRFGVPIAEKPEDIVIVVMGGAGTHSLSVQTRLASENVTVPILRKDGSLWKPSAGLMV